MLKFIASSLLALSVFSGAAAAAQRPNILFVFIDDIGWGDLSCYGNPVTNKQGQPITPNLDRLASQGIRFTQGYVAYPICSPSRTAVLTGMEPARYAMYSYLDNKARNAARNMADWVQPDTVTAPRLFKHAGYKTGQFGKWHMGNGRDVNNAPPPSAYGFDESLVAFEGNGNRLLYWNDDGSKYSLSQQNEDATVGTYQYATSTRPPASTPMPLWRSSPTPSMPGNPSTFMCPTTTPIRPTTCRPDRRTTSTTSPPTPRQAVPGRTAQPGQADRAADERGGWPGHQQ